MSGLTSREGPDAVHEAVASELRAVWRGLRGRRWRAPLIVGLLAVSLGAAVVVFSAADSFVFGRVPYPNAATWFPARQAARVDPQWRSGLNKPSSVVRRPSSVVRADRITDDGRRT